MISEALRLLDCQREAPRAIGWSASEIFSGLLFRQANSTRAQQTTYHTRFRHFKRLTCFRKPEKERLDRSERARRGEHLPAMGRYNFAAQRVHQAATRLLEVGRIKAPPPWYNVIGTLPPSERLVRPALGRPNKRKKASRLFQPLQIKYPEDQLREEFYGDHPWELARPRVVLENDGKDYQRYDWSKIEQPGKQLDGER